MRLEPDALPVDRAWFAGGGAAWGMSGHRVRVGYRVLDIAFASTDAAPSRNHRITRSSSATASSSID